MVAAGSTSSAEPVTPPPPPPPQLSPDEIERGMQRVRQLEQQAMEAHTAAQELNKQGRFDEAREQYSEMRRLDAAALELTQELGCPSCRESASAAAGAAASRGEGGDAAHQDYRLLHEPAPWPPGWPADAARRAAAAVAGCLVADAAATPVQWIYDTAVLESLLQRRREAAGGGDGGVGLEFYEPVQSPFLQGYAVGRNSPYGEQTLLLLRSLAERRGLDCRAYAGLYAGHYTAPGWSGYMNASTTGFLRSWSRGLRPPATGADDQQADCVARLAPLAAAFAGDARLMRLAEAATRTTQDTPAAAAWACAGAAVLERLLQGQAPAAAVQETVQELQRTGGRMPIDAGLASDIAGHLSTAVEMQQQPHGAAVQALGRNCHMPNALQTPLHAVLHHSWLAARRPGAPEHLADLGAGAKQELFAAAVRDALAAGGCCASRASVVGACLGALLGPEALPPAWLGRYSAAAEVQALAAEVCAARGSAGGGQASAA